MGLRSRAIKAIESWLQGIFCCLCSTLHGYLGQIDVGYYIASPPAAENAQIYSLSVAVWLGQGTRHLCAPA